MATRVGRSRLTSAIPLTSAMLVTGSGYVTGDAITKPYELPYALGNEGGLLTQSLLYMTASGLAPQIRIHFYAASASGVTAGVQTVIDPTLHLGHVDHTAWNSAGGGMVVSQADAQQLALYNNGPKQGRSIWAIQEARQTAFGYGASGTAGLHKIGVLQD